MKLALTKTVGAVVIALCLAPAALAGDGMLGVYLIEESESRDGAWIDGIVPGSPADKAELRRGDRIIRCDGEPTPNTSALIKHLVRGKAGQVITIRVERDGWERTFEITLSARDPALGPEEEKPPPEPPPPAPRERGFMGVLLSGGADGEPLVAGTLEGSPAAQAGLREGDEVTSVDGEPVGDVSDVVAAIGRHYAGDTIVLGLRREGREIQVKATLVGPVTRAEKTPQQPQPVEPLPPKPAPTPTGDGRPFVGIALLDNDGQGPLKIDDVMPHSPAERFGLQFGDIILSVNGTEVKTIQDFVDLLGKLHVGDEVLFRIEREGWKSEVKLVLGPRPADLPR
jgi:S1-C subfamily serine protease